MDTPANLSAKLSLISEHWAPKIVARMNDVHFKLARIRGEFVWHSHPETDEAFYVVRGEMTIELPDRRVPLQQGDLFVVPRGVRHRPVADRECHILLVEPAGTVNTGDAAGRRSAADEWI